ncbi:MAG: hypothetical protein NT167_32220 [Verrucomicrobia bacterium]|nr:hypothetical protein [Verrucomicrobiota bacterium]
MLTTLKAVVQGDRIQWLEASEQTFPAAHPIAALITPLYEQTAGTPEKLRAERRLAALKKLASINAFSGIPDPLEWQREARNDRELPGRTS